MNERTYRFLKATAVFVVLAWIAWSFYDGFFRGTDDPMQSVLRAAERDFEDGDYPKALENYEAILAISPDHLFARRGLARSLLMLERYPDALVAYNQAIDQAPGFATSWANRGILHDRMGEYRKALADYEEALGRDPEVAEGPHWMTRFLRLQPDPPPSIADRAAYLRVQLALPTDQQLLRYPQEDEKQRPYRR